MLLPVSPYWMQITQARTMRPNQLVTNHDTGGAHTSPRPPESRRMNTCVRFFPVNPQSISDKASLKPRRDRNAPFPVTLPSTWLAALAGVKGVLTALPEALEDRQYPADRRRLERDKNPAGPRSAMRLRATSSTLGWGVEEQVRGEAGRRNDVPQQAAFMVNH